MEQDIVLVNASSVEVGRSPLKVFAGPDAFHDGMRYFEKEAAGDHGMCIDLAVWTPWSDADAIQVSAS